MRKLYMAITAFAALLFSQLGHAIPTVPGATDIATQDGETYYALIEEEGGWFVRSYDAAGASTGYSVQLSANGSNISSANARYAGLAFDGTSFHALRNDNISAINRDSYSVLSFDFGGAKSGVTQLLNGGGANILASQVVYTALGIADEGFFALRNDLLSPKSTDSWSLVNFNTSGELNKAGNIVGIESGALASVNLFNAVATFNLSPMQYEVAALGSANASVPEPGTGLLLGSMLGLGLLGRKKLKSA